MNNSTHIIVYATWKNPNWNAKAMPPQPSEITRQVELTGAWQSIIENEKFSHLLFEVSYTIPERTIGKAGWFSKPTIIPAKTKTVWIKEQYLKVVILEENFCDSSNL